jgi:hypothetical protein
MPIIADRLACDFFIFLFFVLTICDTRFAFWAIFLVLLLSFVFFFLKKKNFGLNLYGAYCFLKLFMSFFRWA